MNMERVAKETTEKMAQAITAESTVKAYSKKQTEFVQWSNRNGYVCSLLKDVHVVNTVLESTFS